MMSFPISLIPPKYLNWIMRWFKDLFPMENNGDEIILLTNINHIGNLWVLIIIDHITNINPP